MKLPPHLRVTGTNIVSMAANAVAMTLIDIGMAHLRKAREPRPDGPPPREPRTNICIYGLVDPRTHEVRYVGAAVNPLRRRSEHLAEARSGSTTPKAVWLRELLGCGLEPEVRLLAQTTRAAWREVEQQWMGSFSNLTNSGGSRLEEPEQEEE